jgi:hypothetical protein
MVRASVCALVLGLVGVAGCAFDPGAALSEPDAAAAVAPTVRCTSHRDCSPGGNKCLQLGHCDSSSGTCRFVEKYCGDVGDACNQGGCEPSTGECVKTPAPDGKSCGLQRCGLYDTCTANPEAPCEPVGRQRRECSEYVCRRGTCVAEPQVDVRSCPLANRDGRECAEMVCTEFTECQLSPRDPCDREGLQTRTCTRFTCDNGACIEGEPFADAHECRAETDGQSCEYCPGPGRGRCEPGSCQAGTCEP